jgi:uncharacterized membrane protein
MIKKLSFGNLLLAFFALIVVLISARIYYSGNLDFIFLTWNIFLAWIPFKLSHYLNKGDGQMKWQSWVLFAGWLLFFPNALYIITDLVHLDLETNIPKWYDALLLFSAAVLGLMMAFVSLFRAERFLSALFSERKMYIITGAILFLGSFGVYIGRFLRWNSWDIIRHPWGLSNMIMQRIVFPVEHIRTWAVTLILTAVFYLLYLSIKKLPGHISNEAT